VLRVFSFSSIVLFDLDSHDALDSRNLFWNPLWIYLSTLTIDISQYSVWLWTGRPGFDPSHTQRIFPYPLLPCRLWGPPSLLCSGYRGPFPGGKARPGRDADHSPPSSAEVKKEQELCILSPPPPSGPLSLYLYHYSRQTGIVFWTLSVM
jgi:hypothetical protein